MSELEKRQRDMYQTNRLKRIKLQAIIAMVLVLATILTFIPYLILARNTYVNYAETSKASYKVYLKDNTFYDEEYLDENHAYVASLIDRIDAEMKYAMKMDAELVRYTYSYTLDAVFAITDKESGSHIFTKTDNIKTLENAESTKSTLAIDESASLDYGYYNSLAEQFVDTYDVNNYTANLTLVMNVSLLGASESLAEESKKDFTLELVVPLLRNTVNIKSKASMPASEQKILACDSELKNIFNLLFIVFGVLSVIMLAVLCLYTVYTRDKHIDYARKVKRLVSNYRSYIQKVINPFDFEGYKILQLSTFAELLEVRDTLSMPVLMHENEDRTKTEFFIPTSQNLLYLFEIEVEDDDDAEVIFVPETEGAGETEQTSVN